MKAFLDCQALLKAPHALPSLILPALLRWEPLLSLLHREHPVTVAWLVLKVFPSRPEGYLVQLSKEEKNRTAAKTGCVLVTVLTAMTKRPTRASEVA